MNVAQVFPPPLVSDSDVAEDCEDTDYSESDSDQAVEDGGDEGEVDAWAEDQRRVDAWDEWMLEPRPRRPRQISMVEEDPAVAARSASSSPRATAQTTTAAAATTPAAGPQLPAVVATGGFIDPKHLEKPPQFGVDEMMWRVWRAKVRGWLGAELGK
jgi:hypothetical protein